MAGQGKAKQAMQIQRSASDFMGRNNGQHVTGSQSLVSGTELRAACIPVLYSKQEHAAHASLNIEKDCEADTFSQNKEGLFERRTTQDALQMACALRFCDAEQHPQAKLRHIYYQPQHKCVCKAETRLLSTTA